MELSPNISLELEKSELVECNMNDNFQDFLFDVEIQLDKEVTNEDNDWCVRYDSGGDLQEPLLFKEVSEAKQFKCLLCSSCFSDSNAILEHHLSHLQVNISNSMTVFRCDCCASYFTDKWLLQRHILKNYQNTNKTIGLSYKPNKSSNTIENDQLDVENFYMLDKPVIKEEITIEIEDQNDSKIKLRVKPIDGMTNVLTYKPKSYKPKNTSEVIKNKTKTKHTCNICDRSYSYYTWHEHMRNVHGNGGFFCGLCDSEFKCDRYFLKHMKKHHGDPTQQTRSKGAVKRNINCDQCDAVLQSFYALTTHKRNVHSEKKHVCRICKSQLKCRSYLLAHMRRVHYDDGEEHECECGKTFRSPRYLRVHIKNAHSK